MALIMIAMAAALASHRCSAARIDHYFGWRSDSSLSGVRAIGAIAYAAVLANPYSTRIPLNPLAIIRTMPA